MARKTQLCRFLDDWARRPAFRIARTSLSARGSFLKSRTARLVRMASDTFMTPPLLDLRKHLCGDLFQAEHIVLVQPLQHHLLAAGLRQRAKLRHDLAGLAYQVPAGAQFCGRLPGGRCYLGNSFWANEY